MPFTKTSLAFNQKAEEIIRHFVGNYCHRDCEDYINTEPSPMAIVTILVTALVFEIRKTLPLFGFLVITDMIVPVLGTR